MNADLGHRLREGSFPAPTDSRRVDTLIVGAGISGLAAAWWLDKQGRDDFLVLELENEAGGNARGGRSPLVAYPWGAHYLPLPNPEAVYVRELLAELGVLQGSPDAAKPTYDERFLCATPQERVFRHGLWEEGLLPRLGVAAEERAEQQRFHARMEALKGAKGRDGRRVFALPMELSSRDPEWLALDKKTFRQWLLDEGFSAPTVHWLANYACRDDYGTAYDQTSAWAGLHYFACRIGEGEGAGPDTVLTAPEGNAWLARGLADRVGERLLTGQVAWHLEEGRREVAVDVWHGGLGQSRRYLARQVIWAAPAFLLPRVWPGAPAVLAAAAAAGSYAPWLVANLHLSDLPEERRGAPPAWDNVLYDSPGLGYVVATHQLIRRHLSGTVLTYYRAFHDLPPAAGRQQLLATSRETWAEGILAELSLPLPNIRQVTTRLDVFRHGHAMRRPVPGSLWGGERQQLAGYQGRRIHLAHADLSGFSLFEEAQYRGVMAARAVLAA